MTTPTPEPPSPLFLMYQESVRAMGRLGRGRRALALLAAVAVAAYALGIVVDFESDSLHTGCYLVVRSRPPTDGFSYYINYTNVRLRSVALDTQFIQILHLSRGVAKYAVVHDTVTTVTSDDWSIVGFLRPAWQPPQDIGYAKCPKAIP